MDSFETKLVKFTNNPLWTYHVQVPLAVVEFFKNENQKRFLVTLNNIETFHAAILSDGDNYYYIYMNAERRKKLKLKVGSIVKVRLEKDNSKYGMEMPEELSELFVLDADADTYFHALTPGKQRALIYIVDKVKSSQKRIEKAIVITEHLKMLKGGIDFKLLQEAFRNFGK